MSGNELIQWSHGGSEMSGGGFRPVACLFVRNSEWRLGVGTSFGVPDFVLVLVANA